MYRTAASRRVPPDPPDAPSSRPVRADVTTTATAGGVLVAVTLHNDAAVAVRVRVENDLDGPVLPPRREGVPAAGWDDDGFTGSIPANARLGIGYACPTADGGGVGGTPRNPDDSDPEPVSLEVLGPADGGESSTPDRVAAAVRSLGRATPPADAVPTAVTADADAPDPSADYHPCRCGDPVESGPSDVPPPVAAWLDAVETRVRRAEDLTDATADGAAAVLADCGGVDGVATLPDELERDLASLRATGGRIERLLARAAETDPDPVLSSLAAAADGTASAGDGDGGGGDTPRGIDGTGGPDLGSTT